MINVYLDYNRVRDAAIEANLIDFFIEARELIIERLSDHKREFENDTNGYFIISVEYDPDVKVKLFLFSEESEEKINTILSKIDFVKIFQKYTPVSALH